ncbi:hypothetical protein [Micromonospora echinofusca]|uniref:Uncharacterized protein n=1 Tax=Micromonospora echinofusca TaxID=47858 RepID=A0ABS3VVA6_MICEH|nr:hypothetical protein [Micromonospora echinofusca]MBO4208457.1 hypothetical protein [Micromonospora echinofusca]
MRHHLRTCLLAAVVALLPTGAALPADHATTTHRTASPCTNGTNWDGSCR